MNGPKEDTSGSPAGATSPEGPGRRNDRKQPVDMTRQGTWERFVAGEDVGHEVRPEILASWLRCRDDYKVDPWREHAPTASDEQSQHTLDDDVVLAELGGIAQSIAAEVEGWGGLAAVADGQGRILAAWGNRRVLSGASERNSHGGRRGRRVRPAQMGWVPRLSTAPRPSSRSRNTGASAFTTGPAQGSRSAIPSQPIPLVCSTSPCTRSPFQGRCPDGWKSL
jgi:hypothetical protein